MLGMLKGFINPKSILKNFLNDFFKKMNVHNQAEETVLKFDFSLVEDEEGKDVQITALLDGKSVNKQVLSSYFKTFDIDTFSLESLEGITSQDKTGLVKKGLEAFGIENIKTEIKKQTGEISPELLLNPFTKFFDDLTKEYQKENVFFLLSIQKGKKVVSTAYKNEEQQTKYIKHQTLALFVKEISFSLD